MQYCMLLVHSILFRYLSDRTSKQNPETLFALEIEIFVWCLITEQGAHFRAISELLQSSDCFLLALFLACLLEKDLPVRKHHFSELVLTTGVNMFQISSRQTQSRVFQKAIPMKESFKNYVLGRQEEEDQVWWNLLQGFRFSQLKKIFLM